MPRKRTVVNREEISVQRQHLLARIQQQVITRTPGEAVTREQYMAMGYGIGGHQTRNHGDAPIGWEAHRNVDPEVPA